MADLAQVLMSVMAPIQQTRAAQAQSQREMAAKQKIAETQAGAKTYGADQAYRGKLMAALIAAKNSADNAKRMADARLKVQGNDIESAKIKAAAAIAGPFLNQVVNGQSPSPQYAQAVKFLMDKLGPDMDPEYSKTTDELGFSLYGANWKSDDAFMDKLGSDPMLKSMLASDPMAAQEFDAAMKFYMQGKTMGMPQVPAPGLPTSTAPAPSPSAPAASPAPSAGKATPPVGTVKNGYRFKGGNPGDKNNWEPVR